MTLLDAGRIALDAANDRVTLDGEPVALRGKPLRLLQVLMSRAGQLVTKEELIDAVWQGRPHSDAVLTTAIKEIRQALQDNPRDPWAVETVHGRGYRFLLPVVQSPAATVAAPLVTEAQSSRSRWLATSTVVIFLLVAAFGFRHLAIEDSAAAVDSVAVLPFDDLTRDGDHGWFAVGMTEELLNSLTRIDGLLVAARTSTMRFAGNGADIREIGAALGVTHVIEGSVRNSSDGRIRLTAQLIRTDDGFHEWSQTWDRNLSFGSVLVVQRDVSERILDMMADPPVKARTEEGPDTPIPDTAWRKLLMGRELVARRDTDSIDSGLRLLHEAVELVPDYSAAHAALASAYLYAAESMQQPLADALESAERHAARALELNSASVDALLASAFLAIARRDLDEALAFADAAVAHGPGNAAAHRRRGVALGMVGRAEEAFTAFERARTLDPLTPIVIGNFTQSAFRTGRIDDAWAAAEENLRWNGDNHTARSIMGELALRTGHYERALACLESAIGESPNHPAIAGALGELYWRIGADEKALQVANGPAGWPVRGAVFLSRDEPERALAVPYDLPHDGLTGVTALDVYYWTGSRVEAERRAAEFLEALGGIELLSRTGTLPDNVVVALSALAAAGDPRAERIEDLLEQRFAGRDPAHERAFSNLFSGAYWHMRRNNIDSALAWLNRAADLGMVAPELLIDPVFAPLLETAQGQQLLAAMQARAAGLRERATGPRQCQAGGDA